MLNGWFDHIVAWVGTHPLAAGLVIFAIAFCDAVVVLGAIVPALPLLFAIGVLIGLGEISGPYAVACAALGAFVGDGISFWIGRRWGPRLRSVWPFTRYPQLLDRGETMFRRNGIKGILIARYVGPIRPFVPAVAGMLRMPLKRYLPASAFAAASWALLFLIPGLAARRGLRRGRRGRQPARAGARRAGDRAGADVGAWCCTPIAGSCATPIRCWRARCAGPARIRTWAATPRR